MSKRWCVIVILTMFVMVTGAACGARRPTLERESPQVWHQPSGQSEREVVNPTTAGKGDLVRTQQQGKALLKWPDLWVRLYGDTNMGMEEVVPTDVHLSVYTGTALNGGVSKASQRITLTTAYAEITFTGTVVMVAYHPGRQFTLVRVFAGQVEVRNLTGMAQTGLVGAKQWALVRPGEPPQVSYRLEDMRALARELGLWDVFHQVELDVQRGFGPGASRIASGDVDLVFVPEVTPTPTPKPYVQPCAPGVLYCENFDDGQAEGWDLGPGWKVGREGANYVLAGSEHHWATLTGQSWGDYRLRFRLKLLGGTIHLNYQLTEGPVRYFIGFHQGGLYLSKQIRDDVTDLAAVEAPHELNHWYQVEIVGWGGHLQVYVDGKLELDYTDRAPLPRGTIAFETLEGSQALVDDIEVLPPGPEPPRPAPTPTRTPTPGPPDLIVTTWRNTGPVTRGYAGLATALLPGDFEVPFQVVVRNQGGLPAGIFKVSVSYTSPDGTFVAPFTVPGQKDNWYPYTSAPLAAGASVAFEGKVIISAKLQGQTLSLRALADSCAGEERMPGYCRVEEGNEGNNESAPVAVSLPAPSLAAPTQLSPANGSVFENYPRTTRLQWSAVPGAATYTVEIDAYDPGSGRWFSDLAGKPWDLVPNIKETSYTFDFVGAQPGRWRVWAVDANGQEGPQSGWWEFRYTR
jgi:hypothetical protein